MERNSSLPGAVDPPPESRLNRIARRAHEIYQARGGEHGRALEDWLQTEREIDSESSDVDHALTATSTPRSSARQV